MGQIKNIKLHIVTDIKTTEQSHRSSNQQLQSRRNASLVLALLKGHVVPREERCWSLRRRVFRCPWCSIRRVVHRLSRCQGNRSKLGPEIQRHGLLEQGHHLRGNLVLPKGMRDQAPAASLPTRSM